jgi:hypothetical protein
VLYGFLLLLLGIPIYVRGVLEQQRASTSPPIAREGIAA